MGWAGAPKSFVQDGGQRSQTNLHGGGSPVTNSHRLHRGPRNFLRKMADTAAIIPIYTAAGPPVAMLPTAYLWQDGGPRIFTGLPTSSKHSKLGYLWRRRHRITNFKKNFPGAIATQFWGALYCTPFFNFGPGGNALKSAQEDPLLLTTSDIWDKALL